MWCELIWRLVSRLLWGRSQLYSSRQALILFLGISQVAEPAGAEAFISQEAVALKLPHARSASAFRAEEVHQFNLPLVAPDQEVPAREFRAVVTDDRLRQSPRLNDLLENARGRRLHRLVTSPAPDTRG